MGSEPPQKREQLRGELGRLENHVKDTILEGTTSDKVLRILIELAITEGKDRPLFPNLFEEPTFYRTFKQWVLEGYSEKETLEKIRKDLTSSLGRAG